MSDTHRPDWTQYKVDPKSLFIWSPDGRQAHELKVLANGRLIGGSKDSHVQYGASRAVDWFMQVEYLDNLDSHIWWLKGSEYYDVIGHAERDAQGDWVWVESVASVFAKQMNEETNPE